MFVCRYLGGYRWRNPAVPVGAVVTIGRVDVQSLAREASAIDLETTGDLERLRFVVCGSDKLAFRLVEELVTRYGADVTVIMSSAAADDSGRIAALPGVVVVQSARVDADVLRQADLSSAEALALMDQNDGGNVDAALVANELHPQLRIVARIFSRSITEGLRASLPDCAVLSSAALAAPAFVAAALGDSTPIFIRLPDAMLYETRPGAVPPDDVLCGLTVARNGDEPELLPLEADRADLLLARTTPTSARRTRGRHRFRAIRAVYRMVGRRLWLAFGVVVGVLVIGTTVLASVKRTSWLESVYETVLSAFGGANPDEHARPAEKIIQVLLTVASVALVPLLTAAVVDAMVKARLALASGGLTGPISDHVVIVGVGDVGTRVLRALHEFGVPVVAVDRSETARGVSVARELRIPLIIGDGVRAETLRSASVRTCRALVVLTSDDVTNLETGLTGRAIDKDLRVVLRAFDGDFADRLERSFGFNISRSVSYLAAPAFAAAMLGRQVLGTIPVRRHMLTVAELPVGAGSALEGATLAEVSRAGRAHLLAVRTGRGHQTLWKPSPGRHITRTDRLIVVATRAGMSSLLRRTAPGDPAARPPVLVHDTLPPRLHPRPE